MPYIGAAYLVQLDDPVTNVTSMTNAALKLGRDSDNLIDFATTDNKIILRVEGVNEVELVQNALSPVTSDGVSLGTTSLMWSDLFTASGSVINFNNGDMTITHSSNTLTVAGGTFATAALTASTGVFSGILKTDDTTDATTATDGSLQTDGGLSVAKVGFIGTDLKVGDDVFLTSDSSVFNMGAGNDVTLTHDGTTGVTIAANPITIDSGGDIELNADGGDVTFKDASVTLVSVANASGNGEFRIYEGANYVGFKTPALSANQVWVLPNADGSANQYMKTDGSGNLTWASASAGVGLGLVIALS